MLDTTLHDMGDKMCILIYSLIFDSLLETSKYRVMSSQPQNQGKIGRVTSF